MVVGEIVAVVQQVSRYCLNCLIQRVDVLPFYGLPHSDEITLFDPHALVLCLPLAESFLVQIERPYVLWIEPTEPEQTEVSTPITLVSQLQALLN